MAYTRLPGLMLAFALGVLLLVISAWSIAYEAALGLIISVETLLLLFNIPHFLPVIVFGAALASQIEWNKDSISAVMVGEVIVIAANLVELIWRIVRLVQQSHEPQAELLKWDLLGVNIFALVLTAIDLFVYWSMRKYKPDKPNYTQVRRRRGAN